MPILLRCSPKNSVQIRSFVDRARKASDRIYTLSKPTIAAINGFALGGGLELAMCCDLRIASENARFGQPEINLAVIPGAGGTQRLTRLVGMTRAKELIFTGDIIDAREAERIGLVSRVVPAEQLMPVCMEMAVKMAKNPPITLELAKQAINRGFESDLLSAVHNENRVQSICHMTQDHKEGVRSFLEKRAPVYKGK